VRLRVAARPVVIVGLAGGVVRTPAQVIALVVYCAPLKSRLGNGMGCVLVAGILGLLGWSRFLRGCNLGLWLR
jgi:hypothetical protein